MDARAVLVTSAAEREWAQEEPTRPSIRCAPGDWRAVELWLKQVLTLADLRDSCVNWAAERLGCEPAALRDVSTPLRASFAERLVAGARREAKDVSPNRPSPESAARLCAETLGWNSTSLPTLDRLAALAVIAPDRLLTRALIDARDAFAEALRMGDTLACSGIRVALRVEPDSWRRFLQSDDWSRAAARWRMAPLLGTLPAESAREIPTEATERFVRIAAPAATPLLKCAAALIAAEKGRVAEAVSPGARSAAEALLHAVLEARPLTAGRFALNAALDFPFGLRAAEGDLVAAAARLVVELDGYYHFRDADGYRRDRRKDAALQEHGWFVLRFLAEDIVCDLESVVARIECQLARRTLTTTRMPAATLRS